jgi:hypothetical protein
MRFIASILLIFGSFLAQAQPATMEQLTEYMTGTFNSAQQAERDTAYLNVQLKMQRIWEKQNDGVWLYVEQAVASTPDKPYRQRIYKLEEHGTNKYLSRVFELPDPSNYIGAAEKPKRFKALSPEDLEEMEGCAINMIYDERKQKFLGNIVDMCHNDWNGAYVASSEVEITKNKLISWDRGWDSNGKQVWGAEKGGYEFIKQ